jgi:hypothetical protein
LVLSLELLDLQERLAAATAAAAAAAGPSSYVDNGNTDGIVGLEERAKQQSLGEQPKQCQQQQQEQSGMLADDSSGHVCGSTVASASGSASADADSFARRNQGSMMSSISKPPAVDAAEGSSSCSTSSRSLLAGKQQMLRLQQQLHDDVLQQQTCRAHTAERQALQNRCQVVQSLLDTIDDMLVALSFKVTTGTASAMTVAAAATEAVRSQQQQQQQPRRRCSTGRVDGDGDSGRMAGGAATRQPPLDAGSSVWQSPAVDEAAAEQLLSAFVTPSTLSSLAAVMKLLTSSSSLSNKQRQRQQQPCDGSSNQHLAPHHQQRALQFGQPWLPGSRGSRSFRDPVAVAGWAEQEHALVLVKSILQVNFRRH